MTLGGRRDTTGHTGCLTQTPGLPKYTGHPVGGQPRVVATGGNLVKKKGSDKRKKKRCCSQQEIPPETGEFLAKKVEEERVNGLSRGR